MTLSKASDSKILELKERGMSLRQIASTLGISHEAVRKRLNALTRKDHVSTPTENKRLTALAIENDGVSTASNARKLRTCEKSEVVVNRVSTSNAPCPTITESVNPLETPSDKLPEHPECMKGVYQGESGDLFKGIKDFLEAKGVEVYRMNVEPEGYQVKNNGQTIRIYVQRNKMECPRSTGRVRGGIV